MHKKYAYKHAHYTVNIPLLYSLYTWRIQLVCSGISEHSNSKTGRMFGFLAGMGRQRGYSVRVQRTPTDICLYQTDTPLYIVSTTYQNHNILCLPSPDSGQDRISGDSFRQAQRGRSFTPWPCRGRAEEKPLDSLTAVTGAQGRGSIVVVDVGIFAGVVWIIAIITGVAMLDSEGRGRGGVQASPCQIEHAPVVGLIGYQIDGGNMQQGN